jgi:hypothetical protein
MKIGYDAGMGVELLTERHASQIAGVLGCCDRMLKFGTLPQCRPVRPLGSRSSSGKIATVGPEA